MKILTSTSNKATLLFAVAFLFACGNTLPSTNDCDPDEVGEYLKTHNIPQDAYYDAAYSIPSAKNASEWERIITKMEDVISQAEAIEPPPCTAEIHEAFIDGMKAGVKANRTAFDGDLEGAQTWLEVQKQAEMRHDNAIDVLEAEHK